MKRTNEQLNVCLKFLIGIPTVVQACDKTGKSMFIKDEC